MKKFIALILVITLITALLCGCSDVPAFENPIPNTPVKTTEVTEVTEPETQPTIPDITEPTASFMMGEQIWIVTYGEGGSEIRTGVVVAADGQYVITTIPVMGTSENLEALAEALKDSSSDAMEYVEFYPIECCYKTSAEAWAVTGKEPLE